LLVFNINLYQIKYIQLFAWLENPEISDVYDGFDIYLEGFDNVVICLR